MSEVLGPLGRNQVTNSVNMVLINSGGGQNYTARIKACFMGLSPTCKAEDGVGLT